MMTAEPTLPEGIEVKYSSEVMVKNAAMTCLKNFIDNPL